PTTTRSAAATLAARAVPGSLAGGFMPSLVYMKPDFKVYLNTSLPYARVTLACDGAGWRHVLHGACNE
ncbi:MAG: hypothetical protein ACYCUL_06860, partial [Metallibacterium scheffleri]